MKSSVLISSLPVLTLLTAAFALQPCAAQKTGGSKSLKSTTPSRSNVIPQNKRYAIAYLQSAPRWKVGSTWQTSSAVLKLVGDGLVERMTARGFERVSTLDTQCCTIQFALLRVASETDPSHEKHTSVAARVNLLDIDTQQVYSKEYRGQAKSGGRDVKG